MFATLVVFIPFEPVDLGKFSALQSQDVLTIRTPENSNIITVKSVITTTTNIRHRVNRTENKHSTSSFRRPHQHLYVERGEGGKNRSPQNRRGLF